MKPYRRSAFTLVELLSVIAIIAILAAILIPVASSMWGKADEVEATSDSRNIALAWKLYYTDRNQWPDISALGDSGALESDDGIAFGNAYVRLLSGQFDLGNGSAAEADLLGFNPSKEAYLPLTTADIDANGNYIDPWGNPYKFKLDTGNVGRRVGNSIIGRFPYTGANSQGSDVNPEDDQIIVEDTVIAWSRGPDLEDHTPELAEDDPKSW